MKSIMILLLQAATSTTPAPTPSPAPTTATATAAPMPSPTPTTSSGTGTGATSGTGNGATASTGTGATLSLLPSLNLPVCLVRTVTDAGGEKRPFLIAVGPTLVNDLLTGGFALVPCTGFRITAAQYRQEVCANAESGNSAVQARLASVLGVRMKLLCDQATSLGGLLEQVLRPAG